MYFYTYTYNSYNILVYIYICMNNSFVRVCFSRLPKWIPISSMQYINVYNV